MSASRLSSGLRAVPTGVYTARRAYWNAFHHYFHIGATAMTQQSEILDLVQKRRRIARRRRPYALRRSQLEVHRATILALKQEGASLGDIQYYLRSLAKPPTPVARSTIKRFLDRIQPSTTS